MNKLNAKFTLARRSGYGIELSTLTKKSDDHQVKGNLRLLLIRPFVLRVSQQPVVKVVAVNVDNGFFSLRIRMRKLNQISPH